MKNVKFYHDKEDVHEALGTTSELFAESLAHCVAKFILSDDDKSVSKLAEIMVNEMEPVHILMASVQFAIDKIERYQVEKLEGLLQELKTKN